MHSPASGQEIHSDEGNKLGPSAMSAAGWVGKEAIGLGVGVGGDCGSGN